MHLHVQNLSVRYPRRHGWQWWRGRARDTGVHAVRNVTFRVDGARIVSIVGESGSGKTSIGRALLKLAPVASGKILCDGTDTALLTTRQFHPWRKHMQMVFQDSGLSLNPRHTTGTILSEPLEIHFPALTSGERRERVRTLLRKVGLAPELSARYPHELSGGQRQRVNIARALAVEPGLIICDEPVAALDMAAQAQVVSLLRRLQDETGFSCLFISHDLALVEQLSHHVLVMHNGEIVDSGPPRTLFTHPRHARTRALIDAVPHL
ncbi:MAG: ATP-binding cassette domain-containing protein [Puniceicoccales bacterium]|jgi:peptide/nickel transport system ATP-binding protein/oligopeptide transport system ATP-binding protein|nr:ATP-binding cassette domain-containing protein [Puniceicoccales bacterium]